MWRMVLTFFACVMLGACDHDPVFDASNLIAYQNSVNAIAARLSPADQHKLDVALRTLASGYILAYEAVPLPGAGGLTNSATLDGTIPREVYLERMRSSINGRTAAEVIGRVTADLDKAIAYANLQPASVRHQLDAFVIENPRYYWNRGKTVDQPFIEFSVYNGSKQPIRQIYLDAEISAGKHEWARAGIRYGFARPLQAGEMIQVKLSPSPQTDLGDRQLENVYDPDFTLKVANAYDTTGNRLLFVNSDVADAMRRQREMLRGG